MAQKEKSKKEASGEKTSNSDKSNTPIWVALISGLVSITLAILAFQPLVTYFNNQWNATPTSIASPTTSTPIFTETPTEIITITTTDTPVSIIVPSDTPSISSPQVSGTMNPQIIYNYSTGSAPLTVSYNAQSSFVSYPDGRIEDCSFKNVCFFQWDVRQSDGSIIFGPVQGNGIFSHTFQKKGEYTVVVYVCRGDVCNFTGANVLVR